ncbi:MAG TPA: hypothetical protein VK402_21250, partial [Blastococcus sp.]|nr:hypothetical protein [Blastococcus sp.]
MSIAVTSGALAVLLPLALNRGVSDVPLENVGAEQSERADAPVRAGRVRDPEAPLGQDAATVKVIPAPATDTVVDVRDGWAQAAINARSTSASTRTPTRTRTGTTTATTAGNNSFGRVVPTLAPTTVPQTTTPPVTTTPPTETT